MPVKRYKKKQNRYSRNGSARSRYKKRSSGSAISTRFRNLMFAVLTLLLAGSVLVGFLGYRFAKAPFSSASKTDETDVDAVWNPNITNLVFIRITDIDDDRSDVDKFGFISFDSINNHYYIYNFPVDEEFEYIEGYGTATLKDIYRLGNDDGDRGIELIMKTVHQKLAINTDGYVVIDNDGYKTMDELAGGINYEDLSSALRLKNTAKVPTMISTFRDVTITNLKISDIYSILRFFKGTSETSSEVNDLNRFYLLDSANWDQLWQGNQGLSDVKKESIKVLIINGSRQPKIPGLANWGARIVENMGSSVLGTENAFADYNRNVIITDNPDLATVKLLKKTLGIDRVLGYDELEKTMEYNPKIYRSEVTLVLTNF